MIVLDKKANNFDKFFSSLRFKGLDNVNYVSPQGGVLLLGIRDSRKFFCFSIEKGI